MFYIVGPNLTNLTAKINIVIGLITFSHTLRMVFVL